MTSTDDHIPDILAPLRRSIAAEVSLRPEGSDRYRVFTPFEFPDGDFYTIVLERRGPRWAFTDRAHTLMHLSYWVDDYSTGARPELIEAAADLFGVQLLEGEFVSWVSGDEFGPALFSLVQTLGKVIDVDYLSRSRVESTFFADLVGFVREVAPTRQVTERWHHPERDPKGYYQVDIRLNHLPKPINIFAVNSATKAVRATATLLKMESWGDVYSSLVVFEDLDSITKQDGNRLIDVADKAITSFIENKDRVSTYLARATDQNLPT